MIGGIGMCGRPYCCSQFLDDFQPVSTKMAKVQSLSLNPTKISGSCGRLMCCLRYEQEAYEDLIKKVPKQGAFVETKNAQIGNGSKVPHLTYCGDARIGEGVNVGAGTIFANYDGTNKSVTHLGDNVFIGSNSVLVAPVDIAAGAFVAAGSAVVEDIPAGSLAVARGRQHVSEGWVPKRRPASKAAASAANSEQGIHPDVAASREKVAARKPEEYK